VTSHCEFPAGPSAADAPLFRGLSYAVTRLLRRAVLGPSRLRWYERQTEPFEYRSPFGITFELEPHQYVDRLILLDGLYEQQFLEYIASILPPNAVVIDIGANIGNHALFLARKSSVVHAFEPNPTALRRLRRHIEINGVQNVVVHPVGLGEHDGTATYCEPAGNLGAGSFVRGEGVKKELSIRNADEAVADLGLTRVDFVKVDVEGMEESVFRGLQQTIHRFRPLIDFEFLGEEYGPAEFGRLLELLPGYQIFEPRFICPGGKLKRVLWNIRRIGRPDLVPIQKPERRWYENLLAVPT
jgi:FkbM family methyltransferase